MKTFKLFGRYIKKHWFMFILTVLLVIFLNYIRSIVPKLTSSFVAIIQDKPLGESETPFFFLPFYELVSSLQGKLLVTAIIIVVVAFVR